MLTYSMEKTGGLPMYQYLYRCIREDILSGKLKEGERLPSKRSLAKNLNISVITVENAYAQLAVEGYINPQEKRGYFVAAVEQVITPARRLSAEPVSIQEKATPFMDFSSGTVPSETFPFTTWGRLLREVISRENNQKLLGAADGCGVLELRQAIADHLYAFRGMAVSPAQIVVGAGTEYLYQLLIQLLGREHRYAVEDPGYAKIRDIYAVGDVQCHAIPLDDSGMRVDLLRNSGASVAHITPAHHFPTGIVMPVGRRQHLLQWVEEGDRFIVEDDYDCEFRIGSRPVPTLQSVDTAGRVIYMNTFTKSLAPSFRISYMILPPALMERFQEKLGFYANTVSNFEQYTLAAFIGKGYFEKHINRMRVYYREKRNRVFAAMRESPLADRMLIRPDKAGMHFLVEFATDRDDLSVVAAAEAQGIRIFPLSHYYADPSAAPAHIFVMNYSNISVERLPEALCRLARVL